MTGGATSSKHFLRSSTSCWFRCFISVKMLLLVSLNPRICPSAAWKRVCSSTNLAFFS